MLKMSFYDGTLDKEKLTEFIRETTKSIKYTHGLSFRNPSIYKMTICKEKALKIINEESLLDAEEFSDYLHINTYSTNDIW